jgi:phosphoglycolate phosphatase
MIVVDLDGTILDIAEHHHACYATILGEAGYAALPRERYWSLKRQGVSRAAILAETGAEAFDHHFLEAWLERIESEAFLRLDGLLPGTRAALERWVAADRAPTLVTARRNEVTLQWQLDSLGLSGLFAEVVRAQRDDRPWFKGAALRYRHPDAHVDAWIGDTEDDIHAAHYLGAPAIAVTTGLRDRRFFEAIGADAIVDDLTLAAAHRIVVGTTEAMKAGRYA